MINCGGTCSDTLQDGTVVTLEIAGVDESLEPMFLELDIQHSTGLLGDDAPSPEPRATGLAHVAFKIGNSLDEFCDARRELEAREVEILYEADRAFTKSMHMHDPDGNEVELFVDVPRSQETNQ